MAPKFGTSGLRGLVTELTPACVGAHVAAFVAACPVGAGVFVAHDLRPSSPDIAQVVAQAAHAAGVVVTLCGPIPTPALALAAMQAGAAAVMITGSHIPADRNGLKFYTPAGEITKLQEAAILAALGHDSPMMPGPDMVHNTTAGAAYVARYATAYTGALSDMRIGVYAHSAVGAALLVDILEQLGAAVIVLGQSKTFVPVDTEAVAPQLRAQLVNWAKAYPVDAIVSTDGDGDRPLVTDETGAVIGGDILGQITAAAVGADVVVTPVSSNTGVEMGGRFAQVIRTAIGSPFVIAGMAQASGHVVGYEANGGFLLGFDAHGPTGVLSALLTRDALLPIISVLARSNRCGLGALVAAEPPRFTAADRLQDVPTDQSLALVDALTHDAAARAAFLTLLDGAEARINCVDGLRMKLVDGRIVHLRPSGNAPELRLYVEAEGPQQAQKTLAMGLLALRDTLALSAI